MSEEAVTEQKVVNRIALVLAGVGGLGALLDAHSNARALSDREAIVLAATLTVVWIVAEVYPRVRHLRWPAGGGRHVRVTNLGPAPRLAFVGALLLLAYSRFASRGSENDRAWVGMDVARFTLEVGSPPFAQAHLVNTGRTPAIEVTTAIAFLLEPSIRDCAVDIPRPAPDAPHGVAVIHPGAKHFAQKVWDRPLSADQMAAIRSGQAVACVIGAARYKDVFQQSHLTTVCTFVLPDLTMRNCPRGNTVD